MFLTFSSVRFWVSGLKCFFHFELSFVQGDMYEYIWILLHAPIRLVKDDVFFLCVYISGFFVKNQVSIGVRIYLGLQFNSIDQ